MGRLHDWFFNSNHEKCKAEIEQLKLSLAENEASKIVQVDRLTEELKKMKDTRDLFHTQVTLLRMQYDHVLSENIALVAALAEKEPTKRVTDLEHNLMELLSQKNKELLDS